jgi:hypothetical protein
MKSWIKQLDQKRFSYGKYSQCYQDELLNIIFQNIGTTNSTPFCVEFGFDSTSLIGGEGANVTDLVINKKWSCLLLDGNNENPKINLHKHFLTSENICEIFRIHNVPQEPEYISIDVDSTDLWLFKAILKNYRAMLFSVEYNSHFPLEKAITFPNDTTQHWELDRAYGASLKALTMVASEHGYSLLWVVPCLDAFFIRNDLIDDASGQIVFPFQKWAYCTNLQLHRRLKNKERLGIFLDYEKYIASQGDLEKSRECAYETCKTFLLEQGNLMTKVKRINVIVYKILRKIARFRFDMVKDKIKNHKN